MKDVMYETLISAPVPSKTLELVLNNLNDIGRFYEAYPEDEAIQEIVTHIQNFMAPSIRRQIVTHLHHGGVGMKATVQKAAGLLKEATEYPEQKFRINPCQSFVD